MRAYELQAGRQDAALYSGRDARCYSSKTGSQVTFQPANFFVPFRGKSLCAICGA